MITLVEAAQRVCAIAHGWTVADLHRMAAHYWTRYSEEIRWASGAKTINEEVVRCTDREMC